MLTFQSPLHCIRLLLSLLVLIACTSLMADDMRFSVSNKLSPPVPPYQWYDFCTNSYQGFNKELYQRLADDLNLKAKFIASEYADNATEMQRYNLALIEGGKSDFSLSHPAFIQGNARLVIGKEPPLHFNQVIVLSVNRDDLTQLNDLNDMVGIGVETTAGIHELKNIGLELNSKQAKTLSEALQEVDKGSVDFWIAPKLLALNLIQDLGLEERVKFSKFEVSTLSDFYMVASATKRNKQLITEVDQLIARYQQSGYIEFLKISAMKNWLANKSCAENTGASKISFVVHSSVNSMPHKLSN